MIFSRKTILVVGAALLAACGDKVTVQEYTPPATTAKVNFVEVSPATATMNASTATVPSTLAFTAAVNADAGLATTVTWTASAGTITTAGVFTAPLTANPGIAVCAASTVDAGKKGCATVVVTLPSAANPATVSIAKITTAAGGLNAPVNPLAVAGQIDVSVNVNSGTQFVQKVEVFINNISIGSQSFSAAQAAALRFASDEAVALQQVLPQIVISTNTMCYEGANAYCNGLLPADVAGAPVWMNQPQAVKAVVTVAGGTPTASASTNLTFANANGWHGVVATGGTTANATTLAGFRYDRAAFTVTVIPVIYTPGRSVATSTSTTITYGNAGCDASLTGPRTVPLVAGTGNFTASFAQTGTAATSVTNYEFNGCAGFNAAGEGFTVTATDNAGNNVLPAGTAPLNTLTGFRLDNRAPTGLAANTNVGGRTNNWVNATLEMDPAAPGAGKVVNAGADAGVGLVTATAPGLAGITNGTSFTVATVKMSVVGSTGGNLAESATNATFTGSWTLQDRLGNTSAAVTQAFGTDFTAPALAFIGGTANNAFAAAFPAGSYTFSATDAAGAVGSVPSGFFNLAATPLATTQSRRTAAGTTFFCPAGPAYQTSTTACATPWTGTSYLSNLIVSEVNASAVDAYYTISSIVNDQAGNPSAAASRIQLVDATAPTIGGLSYPAFFTGGAAALFSSSTTDALSIASHYMQLSYPQLATVNSLVAGATPNLVQYPATAIDAYNATTLTTSATFAQTVPYFYSNFQVTGALGANAAALGTIPPNAFGFVTNQAGTITPTGAVALLPAAITLPVAAINNLGALGPTNWTITTVVAAMNRSSAAPLAQTFTARAQLLTGANPNPFTSGVDFWVYNAAVDSWRYIGTVTNPTTVTDNGVNRFYDFAISFDADTYTAPVTAVNYQVIAVGRSGGSGLVTPATAVFAINP